MRDLQKVYWNCRTMLDEIGIDYGNIVEVKINTRAKRRWGQCCCKFVGRDTHGNPKYENRIDISAVLLDERVPIEALQNTIIHEILHTCPGCQNHGPNWKARAAKVKRELGYDIKTRDSSQDKGVSSNIASEYYKPKYIVICSNCGREVGRDRMCGIVKYPMNWRCGVCHKGHFERIA